MDDSAEVEAYSSAAAQAYLDKIDDTFVEHVLRLVRGRERGRALDIGSGPGQIVIKLAKRLPLWRFVGAERSPNMVAEANAHLAAVGRQLEERVGFQVADGNRLPFPCELRPGDVQLGAASFGRAAKSAERNGAGGQSEVPAILLRDLRRPGRLASAARTMAWAALFGHDAQAVSGFGCAPRTPNASYETPGLLAGFAGRTSSRGAGPWAWSALSLVEAGLPTDGGLAVPDKSFRAFDSSRVARISKRRCSARCLAAEMVPRRLAFGKFRKRLA